MTTTVKLSHVLRFRASLTSSLEHLSGSLCSLSSLLAIVTAYWLLITSQSPSQPITKNSSSCVRVVVRNSSSALRALSDGHMKGSKGSFGPLSAEAELRTTTLTQEDEFLVMGCDGLWDVMSSQYAVTMARRELMLHNDPERCSRELVREALKRNTCGNLTVVVICFSADPPPRLEPEPRVRRSLSAEALNSLRELKRLLGRSIFVLFLLHLDSELVTEKLRTRRPSGPWLPPEALEEGIKELALHCNYLDELMQILLPIDAL
ncbi:putative protein phosphatase 2C 27 [Nymphaea thermarum]|nr:putative protein phosphatase 2C 27 [Nymphaea thermarum]